MRKLRSTLSGLISLFFMVTIVVPSVAAAELSREQAREPAREQAKAAGGAAAVTLRIGKHPRFFRIVLETSEEHVQKASVMLSGETSIKVAFPSPVVFQLAHKGKPHGAAPPDGPLKGRQPYEIEKGVAVTVGSSSCVITVAGLDDINVSKYSAPARLVIDAYIVPAAPGQASPGAPAERSPGEHLPDAASSPALEAIEVPFASFVIDAGHGGLDSGVQFGKVAEKDIALSFAKDVAALLTKKAKKVALTRRGDHVLTIRERVKITQQRAPDLLLSFHVASGNELVVYTVGKGDGAVPAEDRTASAAAAERDPATAMAHALVQRVKTLYKVEARHERLPLPLLAHAGTTALLIELPSPEAFSYDGKSKARLIRAILQGLAAPAAGQGQGQG